MATEITATETTAVSTTATETETVTGTGIIPAIRAQSGLRTVNPASLVRIARTGKTVSPVRTAAATAIITRTGRTAIRTSMRIRIPEERITEEMIARGMTGINTRGL